MHSTNTSRMPKYGEIDSHKKAKRNFAGKRTDLSIFRRIPKPIFLELISQISEHWKNLVV